MEAKDATGFAEALAEAESMFFRAIDASDAKEVSQAAEQIMNFFAEQLANYTNADVLLALCGFLASFAEFIAQESDTDPRSALMVLQVGMQRAHMASDQDLEMVVPVEDKEHDPRLH